jgi:hypothetical protein
MWSTLRFTSEDILLKANGAGSPEILAEVETIGFPNLAIMLAQNSSRVTRIAMELSSPTTFFASPFAVG